MIEMSRLRLGVLALGISLAGALSGCCGGVHSHKCDFANPFGQDAGTDAPLACGTQVCDQNQVCCLKKIAPYASCIDPADFAADQCEQSMNMPSCFSPADCDPGQVCCLNRTVLSIDCQTPVMCPGGGQSGTYFACASDSDCPNQAVGSCQPVPGVPPGPDGGAVLLYCNPLVQ